MLQPILLATGFAALALAAVGADGPDDNVGIAYEQNGTLSMPTSLLFNGVHYAEVRIVIAIDTDGKLTDSLMVGYTDRTCAEAALAAVKRWTYEPARVHGRARAGRADIMFVFKADVVSVETGTQNIQHILVDGLEERYVYQACQLSELDRIPTPIQVTRPVVGPDRHGERKVTVEFYIDEEGKVRMPVVEREDAGDPYAAAAIAAVEQWRFDPPLRHGHPALVAAKQEFTFKQKP
jgi:TonB family protein